MVSLPNKKATSDVKNNFCISVLGDINSTVILNHPWHTRPSSQTVNHFLKSESLSEDVKGIRSSLD